MTTTFFILIIWSILGWVRLLALIFFYFTFLQIYWLFPNATFFIFRTVSNFLSFLSTTIISMRIFVTRLIATTILRWLLPIFANLCNRWWWNKVLFSLINLPLMIFFLTKLFPSIRWIISIRRHLPRDWTINPLHR